MTIIGDHTDYNGGLSLPMAIELATEVTFTPKPGSFLVGDPLGPVPRPAARDSPWATPPRFPPEAALAAGLLRLRPPPTGGTVRATSTLPVGAGLSSSAAFSVGLLLALGHDRDPLAARPRTARRPSAAPVRTWVCSIRSPSPPPRPGHALHIDFATLETRHVALPDEAAFVIVHSEAPRLLTSTPYATRRAECERAAHILGQPLGSCELGDLSALADPVLRRRARHVVTECARVREAERLLARGNLRGLGAVMTEGHRSLADDYKVSVPAVDELVEHLLAQPGVLGRPHDRRRLRRLRHRAVPTRTRRPSNPRPTHPRRAWRVSPAAGAARLGT